MRKLALLGLIAALLLALRPLPPVPEIMVALA